MTQIKICGITRREDALHAAACGADALGFIFYRKSPRYVTPEAARGIMADLPGNIVRTGVFVNQEAWEVAGIADLCRLDLIQFHGDELPEYCRRFPAECLIKAVCLKTADDLEGLSTYPVRAILLDRRADGQYGGTGLASNWELAARIRKNHRLILAGGLHAGNIAEALGIVAPDAVDINSGVEQSPGEKDREKVREIINIIKQWDAANAPAVGKTAAPLPFPQGKRDRRPFDPLEPSKEQPL